MFIRWKPFHRVTTRLRLIYAHACFVITFLIWKFGGWIEVLTPTLHWLVITFLFWKTSGWIEDIFGGWFTNLSLLGIPSILEGKKRSVITRLRLSLHKQLAIPLVLVWIREPGCKSHLRITMPVWGSTWLSSFMKIVRISAVRSVLRRLPEA